MPSTTQRNEPIAVIGSGCRFPGAASSPSKLWDLLRDPKDVLRDIDTFRADNFYNKDGHYHGASNVLKAYLLEENTKMFDSQFFNIPLSEAEAIDPQQRLLMETVYESLETAGLSMSSLSGSNTAAYVGVMCDDFSQIVYGDSENVPTYAATGSARSILSNRISYFFNWHGPSMTIDTACSSSLIAVHQAVQALRSGESPVAIAAGTNLIFGPTMFVAESNLNMLSPDSRSRMWDADANGYARGEGVGSVVLKTLSNAIRDGDNIECIIRETGVNQDGKTPGITMPSSKLQAALIRDTYARAGLDPLKRTDRCQYFEAHGTGTQAGDPQESGAIHEAFFREKKELGPSEGDETFEDEDMLYVGSIKTIIGHTEGTAGIAGLLKASLAIQNKTIPPNMHFNKLNPKLEGFYDNLKVPVQLQEWPQLPPGVPRRASVNSFGFGGANAHAIIESYEPEQPKPIESAPAATAFTPFPFVFSAASEKSLATTLKGYVEFLKEHPDFSLANLSWTLFRRTSFNFRISLSASSHESLIEKIEAALEDTEKNKKPLGVRVNGKAPREILGVFTGQGAQWATMGREIVKASPFAASVIDELEASLAELPDAPEWSLKEEMLKSKEDSRIAEGVIAQPMCTAVQVMVIRLLQRAGVKFSAVVGHSSGEIACAYVSGFLSATDAVRVAFYRGKYTKLAKGGAMIACGTDMQDAIDLCSLPKLKGRAQLAASNSSSSVTISGDADAIDLVEMIMQDESKFARKLKVDTAYHSFHMKVCSEPYIKSMEECGIRVLEPASDACPWYTSVRDTNERVTMSQASDLGALYWRDNMLQPVLFSQALEAAVAAIGAPGIALEVGPHPALKGPAGTTIDDAAGTSVPYFGTVTRGENDAIAISKTIGNLWSIHGAAGLDLPAFLSAFDENIKVEITKEIPSYPWDHEKAIWNETRVSMAHRLRPHATHELLGIRTGEEMDGEVRWRNYLKPKEMPWLKGHQIQGQMVFPAAGFAVMALEAGRTLAADENIRLMELQNFTIPKGLSFMDENTGVEVLVTLTNISRSLIPAERQTGTITAQFRCYACMNKEVGDFSTMSEGTVKLTLDVPSETAMPERPRWVDNFVNTNVEFFYDSLSELGYGYSGMFQGVTELQRTNGGSKGIITIPQDEESAAQNWFIHPATIDVAFQAVFAAVGAPGDGRLFTLHVPTLISSITVNPVVSGITSGVETPLPFDSWLVDGEDEGIAGDVDIYDEEGKNAICQIQGLHVTPLTKPTAADDRDTFASITWEPSLPNLSENWVPTQLTDDETKLATFTERLSFFVVREICESADADEIARHGTEHQRALLEWAQAVLEQVQTGTHSICPKAWLADTWEILKAPAEHLAREVPIVNQTLWAKSHLVSFMKDATALESGDSPVLNLQQHLLSSVGYNKYIEHMRQLIDQIAFKHRNMRVLEVGSGQGQFTKALLDIFGDNITSITCTDVDNTSFADIKANVPERQAEKVNFKVLDLENDISEQGFVAGQYDFVVASNNLHNQLDLGEALERIRSLVRPGAYFALLEPTNTTSLALSLCGAVRPEWFGSVEETRRQSPLLSQKTWDSMLQDAGFSGIDTATPEERTFAVPFSAMCTMAIDKQIALLRDPLAQAGEQALDADLLIIGGKTVNTDRLVSGLRKTLGPFFKSIIQAETITDVTDEIIAKNPSVLSLAELDEYLFEPFTEPKFKSIVNICDNLQTMLWVTVGGRAEDPHMGMMVGVGRCLVGEMPNLRLQFLNFDGNDRPTADVLAYHLLRLQFSYSMSGETWKPKDPLFTIERELTIHNGKVLLPRYLPENDINTRLNSDRRLITQEMDQSATRVELEVMKTGYQLLERRQPFPIADSIEITVSKTFLNAIKVGESGCLYLVLGRNAAGKQVIGLSEFNQSIVTLPLGRTVEVEIAVEQEANLLLHLGAELCASSILDGAYSSILVHEPSAALARSLSLLAKKTGKQITLTSTKSSSSQVQLLHSSAPERVLSRTVPKTATLMYDMSESEDSYDVARRLRKLLALGSESRGIADLFKPKAFSTGADAYEALSSALERATSAVKQVQLSAAVIPVADIANMKHQAAGFQVCDWKASEKLPVALRPADESMRFRDDRTYFFVGLTGELGLQLTKWMVDHGARYLALTSRNPSVSDEWLERVQSEGAVVKTYAMDVTNRSSVQAVYKQVSKEMPPVAGVANGAMILIDGLFANKTHADFSKTLKPKVDGTIYLDEVFGNTPLDFFMVFSSLAAVSGNTGQSAYAAANAFMCSLIAGRRQRGLAGSAINMPGIVGLGYLNRDARKLDRLKNVGYTNISEWDFYQFFSEAIVAGHPNSGKNPEITAGLNRINMENNANPPVWAQAPRFHWVRIVSAGNDDAVEGEKDAASVRTRLADISSESEVYELLLEGLLHTLYTRLNMNPDQRGITPDTAIVELGVDSLLAVDMRSWFTKELDLDMPVLKILGGATVHDLVDDAVKRLSPELTPKLDRGGSSAEDADDEEEEIIEEETVEEVAEPEVEEEEVITIAPLDLPSFAQPASYTLPTAIRGAMLERTPSSRASIVNSDSEDEEKTGAATPATSDADSVADSVAEEIKPTLALESLDNNTKSSKVKAQLFSHMSEDQDKPLEFIKKVPMSYGTSRFWFLMQFLEDPTTFNLMAHFTCTGPINMDDADRCVKEFGNRHEALRTAFFADPTRTNEPTMGVLEESPLRLERRYGTSMADVEAEMEEALTYQFKIDRGETIRMKMISLDNNVHHVIFAFHHVVMDGFSFNILAAEINQLYDREPLAPVSLQFSDFATRQRKQVEDGTMAKELQFWKDMYSTKVDGQIKPDFPEPLPLFSLAKSSRKMLSNYEFEESSLTLDARTVRQIKSQCRRHGVTTFHFFLAALRTFLFRQLDVNDLVIGIADANRVDNDLDTTVGFMLNLLPLRFKSDGTEQSAAFKDIAVNARQTAYSALAHSKLPFDAMLEKLDIPRSTTHSPLFQAWMDYRPFRPDYRPTMFGAEATGTPTVGRNGYDLTLDVNEVDGNDIRVSFRTQKYLYSKESTTMLFESYMRLVKSFAASFDTRVDSVPLWDSRDIDAAKQLGRGPRMTSHWPETVSHRVEKVAATNPTADAVKDSTGKSYSYEQLQGRVASISDSLTKQGVTQGSRVAVFQQPGADWVASLLAIWHAGATYIPMDLRSSLGRLAAVAKAAKPSAVLCDAETEKDVAQLESSAYIINIASLAQSSDSSSKTQAKPETPAVILFTSGSTGSPKGVVLRHSALRNTFEGLTRQYDIGAEKVLQQSAYTFDFSLDQMLVGLANGGSVYVASSEDRADPRRIAKIIGTEGITYTRATPSEYASWITYGTEDLQEASNWKFAWGGGELMPRSLRESIDDLDLPNLKLYNSYGPAESITCTKGEVASLEELEESEEDISVGKPLPNYSVYIVNRNLELVPQGVSGEILITGPSVAVGYLNNEKLSGTKFINNRYNPEDGRIAYRTGDVGSLRPDGSINFQGRISGDTQIKIRGMRVDLEDIESCILNAGEGALSKAVVSVRTGDLLVAHVQFAPGQYDDETQQSAFLKSLRFVLPLPVYMVPAIMVPVEQLPTNAHGKTDRKAVLEMPLPQINRGRSLEDLGQTEKKLLNIWKELVSEESINAIGITSGTSFFELGGNSLLLVKLQMLLTREFGTKLSLVDIFSSASLGAMAAKVDSAPQADEQELAIAKQ